MHRSYEPTKEHLEVLMDFDRMVDSLDLRSSVCRGQCERKDTSAKKPANMRQG